MGVQAASLGIRRALPLLACAAIGAGVPEANAQIRIGLVAPYTGPIAHYGHLMDQAAKDAVDAINRAGGIQGQRVDLIFADDGCSAGRAREVAERLRSNADLVAVVGHCPSVVKAVRGIYDGSLPLIVPNATLYDLGGPAASVFHLGAREDRLGEAAVRLMRQDKAGNRIAVIKDGSREGDELMREVRRRGQVVFEADVREAAHLREFRDNVTRTRADSVFIAALEPDLAVPYVRRLPASIPVYAAGLPTAEAESWKRFWRALGPQIARVQVVAPRDAKPEHEVAADALASWRRRAERERLERPEPPAAYGAVLAAFEVLFGHLREIGRRDPGVFKQAQARGELVRAMRTSTQSTVLGPLRSGETGEIQVSYSLHASEQEWTPAGSYPLAMAAAPPPPPASILFWQELKPGVYWNSWIQAKEKKETELTVGGAYELAVDLSRYRYELEELSADASVVVAGEVAKARQRQEKEIVLVVRPHIAGFALKWGQGKQDYYRVTIEVDKLAPPDASRLKQDTAIWQDYLKGQRSLEALSKAFNAADTPLRIPIEAADKGCAQIALSIWDRTGVRPLDNLVHTVSVADKDACGIGAQASLSAGFSTLLEALPNPAAGLSLPEAALHVFDLPVVDNTWQRGLALFVDATPLQKNQPAKVYAWWLEQSMSTYMGASPALLNLVTNARARKDYSAVARSVRARIFSTRSSKQPDEALAALQRIAEESKGAASVLVRTTSNNRPVYLPLSLLAASTSSVLSHGIRVLHPAPEPSRAMTPQCVDPWTFVIPNALHDHKGALLPDDDAAWAAKSRQATLKQVLAYLDEEKPMPPAVKRNAEGLVLLAHQSDGNLWFDNENDHVTLGALKRRFQPGSVALLSACSTANPILDNDLWLHKISHQGVDTIFASPFPVPADYGVLLTRHFVKGVREAREKRETPTIAALFHSASDKAAAAVPLGGLSQDIRHEFVLIGDPEVRLCK